MFLRGVKTNPEKKTTKIEIEKKSKMNKQTVSGLKLREPNEK